MCLFCNINTTSDEVMFLNDTKTIKMTIWKLVLAVKITMAQRQNECIALSVLSVALVQFSAMTDDIKDSSLADHIFCYVHRSTGTKG